MAASFEQTLRALNGDRASLWLGLLAAAACTLGVWCTWFVVDDVPLTISSREARVEVGAVAHPIDVASPARVVAVRTTLGASVAAGAPLLELDSSDTSQLLKETQEAIDSLVAQTRLLADERQALQNVQRVDDDDLNRLRLEAQARVRELEAVERKAREERDRQLQLLERQIAATSAVSNATLEAAAALARLEAGRAAASGVDSAHAQRAAERRQRLATLAREEANLAGQLAQKQEALKRLALERDRFVVVAPVAGRVADLQPLSVGQMVKAGSTIGHVLPNGALRVVARFAPDDALGRLRAGQQGWLRLTGFPWTRFGSVAVRVVDVASEVRDGKVDAHCDVDAEGARRAGIVLEHGLPGEVRVVVEHEAPWRVLLRSLSAPSSSSSSSSASSMTAPTSQAPTAAPGVL